MLQRSWVAFLILTLFFFNNVLETNDISNDGIQPSVSHGKPKVFRNIGNFYVHLELTVSETEIEPGIIKQNSGKILITLIATVFLVCIQNKHFYLQLIIFLASGLVKYRTMRLFLIFLVFSILMGRENQTEIHKRTFEMYYSNKIKKNWCLFFF